ncbi:MupG family TIM beta-alpha barrel fold protein [Staphylococcus ureilyticus]
MHNLGISVYPTQSDLGEMCDYIKMSAKFGFKRIFTNLLSVKSDEEAVFNKFKSVVKVAKENDMTVIADINHKVFEALNLKRDDLSFFKTLGVSGIRVDAGFSAQEIAQLSYNKQHMYVELNISVSDTFIEDVLSYQPNLDKLIGCHNFYPQTYTGLSYQHFVNTSEVYKKNNVHTAAFVTSQEATVGPWIIMEGLPTLESHRKLPIAVQVKHLLMTNLVDDFIIGNAFASESELQSLSEINLAMPSFDVYLNNDITGLDETIVTEEFHFNRGIFQIMLYGQR